MIAGRIFSPRSFSLVAVAAVGLTGCSTLPKSGPLGSDVAGEAHAWSVPTCGAAQVADKAAERQAYLLVKLEPRSIPCLPSSGGRPATGKALPRNAAPEITLGTGDVVSVAIFEEKPGGLFTPNEAAGARPGNFIELPPQSVSREGTITVPYAGAIEVDGETIPSVQKTIEERLKNKAIGPQVVVTLREQRATQVSVLGEVNSPAKLPIDLGGERVLDVIARAGGLKYPSHESIVTLQRNGKRTSLPFIRMVANPVNNTFVKPDDTIYIEREEQNFTVFGASGQQGHYKFEAEDLNLAQALGKAQGLNDSQADPKAVFVFRLEDRQHIKKLGIATEHFASQTVPTIYSVDLSDPSGFFLATKFGMQSKDVVYIANAPAVEITKFLQLMLLSLDNVDQFNAVTVRRLK